ncbi:1-phosphatidylinositol 4,5-bisphosphate phosphodiesterase 1 [Yarrowia sp. C11]|nr:1-phosphatidylinositol 4,5-bisphosphate phosphodiesterase 1 [Yarrowia sp. C11]
MSLEHIALLDLDNRPQRGIARYKSLEALRGRKDSYPPLKALHQTLDDSCLEMELDSDDPHNPHNTTSVTTPFTTDLLPTASAPVLGTVPPLIPPIVTNTTPYSVPLSPRLSTSSSPRFSPRFSPSSLANTLASSLSISPTLGSTVMELPTALARKLSRRGLSTSPPFRNRSSSCPNVEMPITRHKNSDEQLAGNVATVSSILSSESAEVTVPLVLQQGMPFLRITHKKKVQRMFKLDPVTGKVSWDDKKASACFSVDTICEISLQENARNHREELKVSSNHESRWVTITYMKNKRRKPLHLVAPTKEEFTLFVDALQNLVYFRQELMRGFQSSNPKIASVHWKSYAAKEQGEERLTFEAVQRLAQRHHVLCSREYLKSKFDEADVDKSGFLEFNEFKIFVKLLKRRPEIVTLYYQTLGKPEPANIWSDDRMTRDDLLGFLDHVQRTRFEPHVFEKIWAKFAPKDDIFNSSLDYWTVDSFNDFLLSSYNVFVKPETNLSRPLNEYYISTSHNTYLIGRQVADTSSEEGYIRALQSGCRSVEIDIWDGPDDHPVVKHGRTFTSSVSVEDVCSAIRKYGFIASPNPLILSLEIHCSASNQLKVVDILKSTFGENLVTQPIISGAFNLPSPEELKHRVLIKVKAGREPAGGEENSGASFSSSYTSSSTTTASEFEDLSGTPSVSGGGKKKESDGTTKKIVPALGELGVYVQGLKFRNFAFPESKTINHCFSFSERKFISICKDPENREQMMKHNRRYLTRIYPSGYRVKSSNLNPLYFWQNGAQMVALNWQTYDLSAQLNDAMFAARGGYVLKPPYLRDLKSTRSGHSVNLSFISAQQLPRPKDLGKSSFDPYIVAQLHGPGENHKLKTAPVVDNGFNPRWNQDWSLSLSPEDYEFSFVQITLYTQDRPFAVSCLRLSSLNEGYRHVPLNDLQGEEYLFSTLFMKVSKISN